MNKIICIEERQKWTWGKYICEPLPHQDNWKWKNIGLGRTLVSILYNKQTNYLQEPWHEAFFTADEKLNSFV